ncbi:MAG: mRNA surveillance protein pelota, partial [Candidatus Micrarchaeota archaeon]|nr:mRNA surveillance protein pelota [Candidatus Micrarchaeota archaeon]
MHLLKTFESTSTIRLRPDSFDDLYLIERIVATGDGIEARSYRRFKPSEGDVGEQKEVLVKIGVEKVELDKGANKLRFTGKILWGRPEEFIKLQSYHTINIGVGDTLDIQKQEWKDYILKRIKQSVQDSKKPRLGVIAVDEEKATVAYIRGYGIEIITELYSKLSKRMKEKDYELAREKYFNEIIDSARNLKVDIVAIAGPGFTKDDIRKYLESKRIKVEKRLVFAQASDAERGGIREAMQSDSVTALLAQEQVKREFELLNKLLSGLSLGASSQGISDVRKSLEEYDAAVVMVNDSVLNSKEVQDVLDIADKSKVRIEIFNSDDDAGKQLASF